MASTFLDKDMDAEMKELEEEGIEDSEDEGDSMSGKEKPSSAMSECLAFESWIFCLVGVSW